MCALINLFLFFVCVTVCFGKPSQLHIEIKPKADMKNVGEHLNVLCTVPNTTLTDCLFDIGSNTHKPLLKGDGDIVYYGTGLENGECGATIKNVTVDYHGKIICKVLVSRESSFRTAEMNLIIRKMPNDPVLTLKPHNGPFVEGDHITASCKVNGGRPAPDVSLSIGSDGFNGGQKLPHPEKNDVVVTKDWILSSEDDRKNVTCAAHHDSWEDRVRYNSRVISVQYKPIIHDNEGVLAKEDIVYSGLVLGENASVIVKVKANPKPTLVRWAAGNETISDDDDERIRKEEIDEDNGIYIYKLSIANLTKSDVLNGFLFEATNTIGNATADIRLQTKRIKQEPRVPQSQASPGGSAAALVCAGAALLVVGGVVLLAKLKKKCCFASKAPPVHTGHLIVNE